VLGNRARGDAFNVVSRLSDIGDILGGLRVIYAGIRPAIASVDPQQAAQTKRELDSLWSFVAKLRKQERAGRRFTPEQADTLGRTAQERASAIAGQVTQAAARLKVKIAQ
jgi:Imelysin